MYLFFDTETTGLPRDWNAPAHALDNWPRLVQIAWVLYDEFERELSSCEYIIKPDNYAIPLQASRVHGITTERATREGVDLKAVLEQFAVAVGIAEVLVAHNSQFDEHVIGAECIRTNVQTELFNKRRICTMKGATDFCAIPGPHGPKWPTLTELYYSLFAESFEETHTALADTTACAKCFFALKKRGILS